jgi:chromosome segregation ATPase
MTEEFGKATDDQGNQDGKNFGSDGTVTDGDQNNQGMTPDEIEALRKRDAAAQAHIEKLERENKEARDKVVELQDNLSKATTLDEALERIQNQGDTQQETVGEADVAQIVEKVLGQKQTQDTMDSNWNAVLSVLTETHGDWDTANLKVQERARELDISDKDASMMARQNPKAFLQLFNQTTKPAQSSGSGEVGQRTTFDSMSNTGDRDKMYYAKLRRENPNKYWSVDVQAQMRRDLFNA